ncbi:dipeptide epimerase [Luteimonas sp. MC1782]|uniref:N-acetyl-D-Glu racemase DgcA n=1 Tax=Luteimonas sp. MC1782 TaxID=2760305 RepID=UPI0015FF55B4|nr:N-acetyl-D-Glu racemase DgcA [Luteimonas sp. MC1782]MBB1472956.1 dipeptide epimerase [Luteimonas sp. MC1782]
MLPGLTLEPAVHPLSAPFRISRGVRTSTEVLVATASDGRHVGRGESLPYARYDETVASVAAQAAPLRTEIAAGMDRRRLCALLGPGAARNALDCALWDLEARRRGMSVAAMLGQPDALPALCSAQTVSLDTPANMARAAAGLRHLDLVKVKVDANDPAALVRAVRAELPAARLIVDPNESWDIELLRAMQPVLAEARVDLVEQPLPAAADDALQGFASVSRLCADESCHVAADLPRLRARYQVVNIKLDKTGGLTAALDLLQAAQAGGFGIMVGCMISSSLAIAPAWHVARHAEFIDLDGPLWLREDHAGGVAMRDGMLQPASPQLWGGGRPLAARRPAATH